MTLARCDVFIAECDYNMDRRSLDKWELWWYIFAARNAPHFETVARSPQQVARAAGRRRILLTLLAVLPPTFFSYIAEVWLSPRFLHW